MANLKSNLILSLVDRVSGPARGISGVLGRLSGGMERLQRRSFMSPLTGLTSRLLAVGGGYLALSNGLRGTVGASIAFEEKFAEVRKVLDGSPQQVAAMRTEILALSKRLPVAANGLADIMSAAGQAGIAIQDLPKFTEFTAKSAVAFDMSEAEIGDRFAKLKNVFNLDQAGLEELANASNLLSNNMASTADDVTDFANRAAGAVGVLNLLPRELAAVGSAMTSAGIQPETAARGISAMTNKIVAGGPKVSKAFRSIGLTFKDWRKLQATNGPEALTQLFTAASRKGEAGLRALQDLVGQDFSDDFSKIVANPKLLADAFAMVADPAKVANSVQAEFINKSDTAAAKIQLLRNNVAALGIAIGDLVAPALGNWAKDLADTLATLDKRVTVFDTLKAKLDGFATGLGFKNVSDAAGAWAAIRDNLFGKTEDLVKDTETMGRSFEQFRQAGASFRAALDSFTGAKSFGETVGAIQAGMSSLGGAFSLGSVATIGLGALALRGLGRALLGLALGRVARLGLLAWGLSALTEGGTSMSAVDWAALGIGLSGFAGGLSRLVGALGRLKGVAGVLGRLSPYLAMLTLSGDTPKETKPTNWEADPRAARWKREALFAGQGPANRTKDDDAFAGWSKAEKELWFAPPPERPLHPSLMNDNLRQPNAFDRMRDGMGGPQSQANPLDALRTTIVQTRSTGVSDVRMTNPPQRPNVSVTVNQNVTMQQAPTEAAKAAADATGQTVKAAVESALQDGAV